MTAGYSGTQLVRKLGLKEGLSVSLVDPPDGFRELLEPADFGLIASGPVDVVIVFACWQGELVLAFQQAMSRIPANGAIWVAWPKKASRVPTDISENDLRDLLLPTGMVDNKVAALTEVWSGLRFVVRREHRPAWTGGVAG